MTRNLGTLRTMLEPCEVCRNFRPEAEVDASRPVVEVFFGSRPVLLCRGHAKIAERAGVTSLEGLREYYGTGRRSFVPRRGRGSTPQADERRESPGRRETDLRR